MFWVMYFQKIIVVDEGRPHVLPLRLFILERFIYLSVISSTADTCSKNCVYYLCSVRFILIQHAMRYAVFYTEFKNTKMFDGLSHNESLSWSLTTVHITKLYNNTLVNSFHMITIHGINLLRDLTHTIGETLLTSSVKDAFNNQSPITLGLDKEQVPDYFHDRYSLCTVSSSSQFQCGILKVFERRYKQQLNTNL